MPFGRIAPNVGPFWLDFISHGECELRQAQARTRAINGYKYAYEFVHTIIHIVFFDFVRIKLWQWCFHPIATQLIGMKANEMKIANETVYNANENANEKLCLFLNANVVFLFISSASGDTASTSASVLLVNSLYLLHSVCVCVDAAASEVFANVRSRLWLFIYFSALAQRLLFMIMLMWCQFAVLSVFVARSMFRSRFIMCSIFFPLALKRTESWYRNYHVSKCIPFFFSRFKQRFSSSFFFSSHCEWFFFSLLFFARRTFMNKWHIHSGTTTNYVNSVVHTAHKIPNNKTKSILWTWCVHNDISAFRNFIASRRPKNSAGKANSKRKMSSKFYVVICLRLISDFHRLQ